MYRVLVVDDEPSVLDGLRVMIPWSELNLHLCGESSNAQEALLKIIALRPHLIITDIRMPQKNGLELIDEVRKLDITTEFVILSGYPDFSYAREAMRNRVAYYLLKPIDTEEFISVLLKVRDKLDATFLTSYGFSQSDIEAVKTNPIQSVQNMNNDTPKEESDGVWWKFVRDGFDEDFATAVKLMNGHDAKKLLDELFDFLKSRHIDPSHARVYINTCIYHILYIAFERNIKLNIELPPESSREWSLDELKSNMEGIISKAINLMLEDRRKNARSCLYEVKAYIEKKFDKELSVSFLADMVFLETGYLGNAFSKQFGCSISEYQHRLRIEKAVEMIKTTDMKLSHIASTVGYNNYNNFFSHFTRITHKKPTQIRKHDPAPPSSSFIKI